MTSTAPVLIILAGDDDRTETSVTTATDGQPPFVHTTFVNGALDEYAELKLAPERARVLADQLTWALRPATLGSIPFGVNR